MCTPDDDAEAGFEAALATHAGVDRPYVRARTELAYGRLLRRRGARRRARDHLLAAAHRFEYVGADRWAAHAEAELRASGASVRRRDPPARDRLTAQELRISAYVADGLSNKEVAARLFLSPRTIDFHLRNVFAKLGVRSRTELAGLELPGPDGGDQVGAPPAGLT